MSYRQKIENDEQDRRQQQGRVDGHGNAEGNEKEVD